MRPIRTNDTLLLRDLLRSGTGSLRSPALGCASRQAEFDFVEEEEEQAGEGRLLAGQGARYQHDQTRDALRTHEKLAKERDAWA